MKIEMVVGKIDTKKKFKLTIIEKIFLG